MSNRNDMLNDDFKIILKFNKLKNQSAEKQDFVKIGRVHDNTINRDVVIIYYDKFQKITTVIKVGLGKDENENDLVKIFIGDKDYIERFRKNENLAKFSIFHELGHFINGDFDNLNPNNDKIRESYIRNGEVQPSELKADEFALGQMKRLNINLNEAIEEIDYRIHYRKLLFRLKIDNSLLAVKELELRKRHIVSIVGK